jgi:hypothetical protein
MLTEIVRKLEEEADKFEDSHKENKIKYYIRGRYVFEREVDNMIIKYEGEPLYSCNGGSGNAISSPGKRKEDFIQYIDSLIKDMTQDSQWKYELINRGLKISISHSGTEAELFEHIRAIQISRGKPKTEIFSD